MIQSGNSTWPRDILNIPKDLQRRNANHLICFLACPFDPPEKADDLLLLIQSVCNEIGQNVGAEIECIRADKISTPGTIHSDIWKHLELADALIFDVTDGNGNVLLELGVAAACRSQDNIIILRDQADAKTSKFLFDIAPNRHLLYQYSWVGLSEIRIQLKNALIHALTPAPYKPIPQHKTTFPLEIDLSQGNDSIDLLSPPMLHRRNLDDGLEFGSLYIFPNSWITIGDNDHALVNIEATMRFSDRTPNIDSSTGWIGIALRSQHFYANYSHLIYLTPDGTVWHTEPINESKYNDIKIDSLVKFNLLEFVTFNLDFGVDTLQIRINEVSKNIDLKTAPHIRHAGKIRLQTYLCRAVVKNIKVNVSG